MHSLIKEEIAKILRRKAWPEENFLVDRNSIIIKNLKINTFSIKKIQDILKNYKIQKLRFESCSFCKPIKIDEEDRGEDTLFNEVDLTIFLSIEFYECIFTRSINLSGIYFKYGLGFYCSEFKDRVNFGKSIFAESLILFDIIANHHISFLEAFFFTEVDIEGCYFDRNLNFSNSSFNILYSRHSYFKEVNFSKTEFRKSVLFKNCQFEKKLLLEDNSFKDGYNFCFISCVFDEYVVLDTKSEKKICNIQKSKHDNVAEKAISEYFENENCYRLQRDFFRRMKNNRLKNNDVIGASRFKVYELEMREKELKKRRDLNNRVEGWFLGFFRSISNHHTDLMSVIYSFSYALVLFALFASAYLILSCVFKGEDCLYKGLNYLLREYPKIKNCIINDIIFNILLLPLYVISNYFVLVYPKRCQKTNLFVLFLSIVFMVICPKLLLPLSLDILKGQYLLNPLSNLCVLYTIILGIITWSLIRTGQKNTKLL